MRGYDALVNIVLDDTVEVLSEQNDVSTTGNKKPRSLGLVVCRGTAVSIVYPSDGALETSNPYEEDQPDE